MPTLPEKIITALRELSDVRSVGYSGYTLVEEEVKLDDEAKAAAAAAAENEPEEQETDEDGNPIEKKPVQQKKDDDEKEIKRSVEMTINVVMKGGEVNLNEVFSSNKEAE